MTKQLNRPTAPAVAGQRPDTGSSGEDMSEEYEAPQAIRLDESDRAYGACLTGSLVPTDVGYRVHEFEGVCVTGKSASGGCHAGV